ncbi:MAG TPA: bifunctional class I SAM-dependent methyltransferase/glycosyltransferase family 2 protein [Nitrospira sp.]|nr:bifunctional class I SAM-dependent methyltransferase/glycosyltransferase family 2 protein [Nitrospira sp.]
MSVDRVTRETDKAYLAYQARRRRFWNGQVGHADTDPARYYHERLAEIYRFLIPSGATVIELGCGDGDLLAALEPKRGVGVDFSESHVKLASGRHPSIEFVNADVHELDLDEKFDYVVISDLVNDIWDVQGVLERVSSLCHPGTRIVVNFFNKAWQVPIGVARSTGLAQRMLRQNWLSVSDMKNLMRVAGFEIISTWGEIMFPFRVPVLSSAFNRVLVRLWPLNHLSLTQFLVARPDPFRNEPALTPSSTVSVVVPARNEAGHIREILERVPSMGSRTEILFVEGNSTDNTLEVIKEAVNELDDPNVRYYQQPGKGKGDAVRFGYQHATGDVLMILDADMTVAPEDLPRFFEAIANGSGEFINGVRLIYPMEQEAMQFLNYLGNKCFSLTFSWLLRQPVKDTLCGTKVLSRTAYDTIAEHRSYFGDFDPFGDFDLLFGAAKANLRIVDIPIRYRQRRYGSTNIDRWRHGALLIRMAWFAARKLRFV